MRSHTRALTPVSARADDQLGSVVGAREESVQAGLEMFHKGGNAVDAAVAAALVAGVIEPTETTLAGSGFLLYSDGEAASPQSVEFGPKSPLAATPDMFLLDSRAPAAAILGIHPVMDNANVDGPRANGVPRTLLGLLVAQERWGRLSRKDVCQPAIESAYEGFRSDSWFVLNAMSDLERLRQDPACSRIFLADDGLPRGRSSQRFYGPSFGEGERIRQQELGTTLEEVASSSLRTLTDGDVAARMVMSSKEMGGLLSMEDFKASAPLIGPAKSIHYRDAQVSVPRSPGGGLTELQILKIWESIYPDACKGKESPERLRSLALAIRHAFADRYHWLGDPDFVSVPERGLLDPSYIAGIAALCANGDDVAHWNEDVPWRTFATRRPHEPSFAPGGTAPDWSPLGASTPTSGTTHISATDVQGRTVAITHTAANHFGSGVICPRTGLLFDSAMAWFNAVPQAANSISGGARPVANMGPSIVTHGRRSMAVGASGGRRIISAVAQLIINLVDEGMSAEEALQQPRIDASGTTITVPKTLLLDAHHLEGLGCTVIPEVNDPYAIDYARPNIAITSDGKTSSAIESAAYGD
jgi:gamma-glutamyltranspeptidase/glutathione hydrolase